MLSKIEILQQRRVELVRRAAIQRQALHQELDHLDAPLRVAEKTIQISHVFRRYSWVVVLGGAAILGAWFFRKSPQAAKPKPRPIVRTLASLWKGARLVFGFWQTIRHF